MGCFDSFLGGNNGCCWIIILIAVKPYIPPVQSHKRAAVSAARFPFRLQTRRTADRFAVNCIFKRDNCTRRQAPLFLFFHFIFAIYRK